MANSTAAGAAAEPKQTFQDDFAHEVADAMLMLDYLVANGLTEKEGRSFDENLIVIIKLTHDAVLQADRFPEAPMRAEFEKAYRQLARFLAPVTAATLKATSSASAERSLFDVTGRASAAIVWSRKLWAWTLLFTTIAIAGSYLEFVHGTLLEQKIYNDEYRLHGWQGLQALLQLLVPFTYGAIGACVYLLKSSHYFIYTRQFDPLYKPEYYNRMILGAIGGGMMVLLVDKISFGGGSADADSAKAMAEGTIALSAKVVGFLTGYNTDLLFSAIERISNALLPKIGIQSVQRAPQAQTAVSIDDISLKDLLDRYNAATTDEARKLYEDLIKKLRDRI
jgi:hypothetical protein